MSAKDIKKYLNNRNVIFLVLFNLYYAFITVTTFSKNELFFKPRITEDHSLEFPGIVLVVSVYLIVNGTFLLIMKNQSRVAITKKEK